jgi:hypothetical protein
MPVPIVCLSDLVRQYAEAFRGCFSQRQWKYFVTVLLGLIECQERRTLSALVRVVGDKISLSGVSRFLSVWPWSPQEVAHTWQTRFRKQMTPWVQAEHARQRANRPKRRGHPKATVVTGYLILDDSVHVKPKGRKMGGLGRHYSTTEKRTVTGHCLFTGLYVLLGRRCPLPSRLYRQKAVCEREQEPFQSKVDMAVETIADFQPVPETHTHVLIDSWFHCRKVRRAAQQRGWDVSGGLKSNRQMRLIAADGTRRWIGLAEYAATLGRDDYQAAIWPSQHGGHPVYVHAVRTWVRKLGPTLVLVTRRSLDEPLAEARYWGTTRVDAEAQAAIDSLAIRWDVEVLFENDKDLLGSDHYQVMSATAVVRFWTLVACLGCFLDEHRARLQARDPEEHVTWGDARRDVHSQQLKNLLGWLEKEFQAGATPDQIYARLAA